MAVVSVYSVWQGYSVAGRSRRWEKQANVIKIAALLSNGEPLPFTDEEETEPMTIIYQTTFIVNVKQSESAKKPLNTVFQDICKHEVLGGFFTDKSFNLEKLQKSS